MTFSRRINGPRRTKIRVTINLIPLAILCYAAQAQALRIRYVNDDAAYGPGDGTSWKYAFTELYFALNQARIDPECTEENPCELWVAAGTYTVYYPYMLQFLSFDIPANVDIYGGFAGYETLRRKCEGGVNHCEPCDRDADCPDGTCIDLRDPVANPTILSGDLNHDDQPGFLNRSDNSYHVVTVLAHSEHRTVIDGFTIQGGYALDDFPGGGEPGGGGIRVKTTGGKVAVRNCTIRDNYSVTGGGGIYAWGENDIWVVNSTIEGNEAGSYGGGMAATGTVSPQVVNSRIINNQAYFSGGAFQFEPAGTAESHAFIVNCLIAGNSVTSGNGGGIEFIASPDVPAQTMKIINSTIASNTATYSGGGVDIAVPFGASATAIVNNNVVWDNQASTGPQIAAGGEGTISLTVKYSDVEGGWTGTGNIDSDPLFVSAVAGDYHLQSGSPCIDTPGATFTEIDEVDVDDDGEVTEVIPWDLDKRVRVSDADASSGAQVDMGAYEPECIDNDACDDGASCSTDSCDLGTTSCVHIASAAAPAAPTAGTPASFAKMKVMSINPGNSGMNTALRVEIKQLPYAPTKYYGENYDQCLVGTTLWVGEPFEVSEAAAYGIGEGLPGWTSTFWAAELECVDLSQDDPFATDWTQYGTIHIFDTDIVPMNGNHLNSNEDEPTVYEVRAVAYGCDMANEANMSGPLTMTMSKWGDITEGTDPSCEPTAYNDCWMAPDGIVNIMDRTAYLNKYSGVAGAPMKVRADHVGIGATGSSPLLDLKLTVADTVAHIDAFSGHGYPFAIETQGCPRGGTGGGGGGSSE